jgi:hypothetical protein
LPAAAAIAAGDTCPVATTPIPSVAPSPPPKAGEPPRSSSERVCRSGGAIALAGIFLVKYASTGFAGPGAVAIGVFFGAGRWLR